MAKEKRKRGIKKKAGGRKGKRNTTIYD